MFLNGSLSIFPDSKAFVNPNLSFSIVVRILAAKSKFPSPEAFSKFPKRLIKTFPVCWTGGGPAA
jgi:hypothetical protein